MFGAAAGEADPLEFEMGITHADFFRIFPRLLEGGTLRRTAGEVIVAWADARTLVVGLSAEHVRRIAGLRIPYVTLTLRFLGFSPLERRAFLTRFERAFQKGGG